MKLIAFMGWIIALVWVSPALAAQGDDPDWPCIQRKVPELTMGQVWNGPELPPEAEDWPRDTVVAELVEELAARRLPLNEAQERIKTYKESLPDDQKQRHVAMLVRGLFDKLNGERAHVISGIARYAHRQRDMAASLRRQTAELDALRAKLDADANTVAVRNNQLMFQIRIFQERVKSLTYVCEVPTLIEQRLYALVKTLDETHAAR